MIRLLTDNCAGFVHPSEIENMRPQLQAAWNQLRKRTGPGQDYLGWLDWPTRYDRDELDRIRKAAGRIRRQSDVLVVIGIGGSYLGARAAIEMLSHTFAGMQ
jgi:glucose-6-phosphate isomerase